MKSYTPLHISFKICAFLGLGGISLMMAGCTDKTDNTEKIGPTNSYGQVSFFNSRGEKMCSLAVPEIKQVYDFSSPAQSCENNRAATFQLDNVPSATLINFYENEACADGKTDNNFFVKLKTVKQPTSWMDPPAQKNFKDFKTVTPGQLIPNRNIRVEDVWDGKDYVGQDWDERISCVYIERSQPAN